MLGLNLQLTSVLLAIQGKNNILFIGDSTAHNYYLGLKNYIDNSRVYDNFSLNVLAVTGCIPLVDDYIDSQQFTGKEEKCEFAYKEINNILNNYFLTKYFFLQIQIFLRTQN